MAYFPFRLLVYAVLLVFGFLWCKEILGRFGKDLDELRGEADGVQKGIIVTFWALTGIIMFGMYRIIAAIIRPFLGFL